MKKLKVSLIIMCIVTMGALAFSYFTQKPSDACLPTWGTLKVQVTNNYGTPLRNANVSVWWLGENLRTGLTDSYGEVSFGHLDFDWYNLTVMKTGSYSGFQTVHFDHDMKVKIVLPYLTFTLVLNVSDANSGLPLVGTEVQLYRYDYLENYQSNSTPTNLTGLAMFSNVEYDEYGLNIRHGGYFNQSLLLFLNETKMLAIQLYQISLPHPTYNLFVNVSEATSDAPLSSATVFIYGYDYLGHYYTGWAATNGSGLAVIEGLEYGVYAVVVSYAGYESSTLPLLQINSTRLVEVKMQASGATSINLTHIVVGIVLGFIFAVMVFWFYLLQRRLRKGTPKTSQWKGFQLEYRQQFRTAEGASATAEGVMPPKVSLYDQPDIFEGIMYVALIAFFIAVFQNITYIGSPVESERIIATQYLAIAALGSAGLAMRSIYDHIPVRDNLGHIIANSITETVHEAKNIGTYLKSLVYFAIAFGVQVLMSFVIMLLPLSIFSLKTQMIVMGVIGAVGEELFFSYFVTGLLVRKLKWATIPVVSIIFVWYHFAVYQSLSALLYVGVMRLIYSTVYIYSRRLSSVTLAHVLNNLLVGLRM